MEKLTDKQKNILQVIKQLIAKNGYPPTVREICAAVGVRSTSTVHSDLHDMIEHGYLETDNEDVSGKSRAIRVPGYKLVRVSN